MGNGQDDRPKFGHTVEPVNKEYAADKIRRVTTSDNATSIARIFQLIGIPLTVALLLWTVTTFDDLRFRARDLELKLESLRNLIDLRMDVLTVKDAEFRAEINRIWAEVLKNSQRVENVERKTNNAK